MCPNLIFCLILSISQCVNLQTPGDFCLCLSCSIKIFCLCSYLQDVVEFLSHCEDSLCRSYLQQFLNSLYFFITFLKCGQQNQSHILCQIHLTSAVCRGHLIPLFSVVCFYTQWLPSHHSLGSLSHSPASKGHIKSFATSWTFRVTASQLIGCISSNTHFFCPASVEHSIDF